MNELVKAGRAVKVRQSPSGSYSYDGASQASLSEDLGGELVGSLGACLGVSVASGGDGMAVVYRQESVGNQPAMIIVELPF